LRLQTDISHTNLGSAGPGSTKRDFGSALKMLQGAVAGSASVGGYRQHGLFFILEHQVRDDS